LWLNLNPRTGQAYFEGAGEPEVQATLEKHLRPGMTVYDVGANIGLFSMIAARLVGPQGSVVAFEADPEIAARLREHLSRNEFRQATVEEAAVWSETKQVYFERADPAASPDRGLGRVVEADERNTARVSAVSLDDYAQTHAAPDFVKCDVEGAEVEVFRGAKGLLREKRPVVVCEMHSEENRRALTAEFTASGYSCAPCGANHVLARPA
jgi:FkbM family methyltransferase